MVLNGKKVRELRLLAKISQFDLADECKMNPELISKIENGRRAGTSLETAYKLSKFFNVKIDDLI